MNGSDNPASQHGTSAVTQGRYERWTDNSWTCLDCGSVVASQRTHDRFHSILGGHAWALAVLKTAHLAAHVHDRYEVGERIDSKTFDTWTHEALAEVVADLPDGEPDDAREQDR